MTDTPDTPPAMDAARVLATRAGLDEGQRRALYRRVFGGQDGQVVLIDLLASAGVATPRPHTMGGDERLHLDGQAWAALTIVNLAGYDVAAISAALINSSLRGLDHDRHHHDRHEPDVRLPGGSDIGADEF